MKLKILYIITQGHWGGAQKYVADLALSLSKQPDYEITVTCGEQSEEFFNALKNSPVKTIHLPHLVRAINPLHDIRGFFEIIKLLKTGQFDIVHANSSKAGFLTAIAHTWLRAMRVQTYRARLVYTAHGWVFLEPLTLPARWLFLLMERITARLRDSTIVLSKKEETIAFKTLGLREKSVHVIPNGIDCTRMNFFDRNTARKKILELQNGVETTAFEHSWVGTIANLYATKGIEILIRAAFVLRERDNATKTNTDGKRAAADLRAHNAILPYFFVIGEGPERTRLQTLIQTLNLTNSFFLVGTIKNAAEYLKAFDIFVLPSLKEGFPYIILEAACAGIPIIASNVGAIPEIIQNGENGLLVVRGNSAHLADAIMRALTNQTLRIKLQNNAPRIADKFSFEKMIEKTKNFYHEFKKGT